MRLSNLSNENKKQHQIVGWLDTHCWAFSEQVKLLEQLNMGWDLCFLGGLGFKSLHMHLTAVCILLLYMNGGLPPYMQDDVVCREGVGWLEYIVRAFFNSLTFLDTLWLDNFSIQDVILFEPVINMHFSLIPWSLAKAISFLQLPTMVGVNCCTQSVSTWNSFMRLLNPGVKFCLGWLALLFSL